MAASSYDEALNGVLVSEGGYSNHPADPGGPTNFGITIGDYRKYVNLNATAADVRSMPVEVAKKIYRERYWNAVRGDDLPAGVDYAVFDYAINSGVSRAAKMLQQLVGVTVDGEIGDDTIKATAKRDSAQLVGAICDERLAFLERLGTWSVFGNGWGRRVREVRAAALAMAKAAPGMPANAPAKPLPTPPAASSGWGVILQALLDRFMWRRREPEVPARVPSPTQPTPIPADSVPPWLATMRSLQGTSWMPGQKMPPAIQEWVRVIGQKYPEMASYLASAGNDYFSCCGLGAAYAMAMAGIRPPFGEGDLDRFLWADSWRTEKWGQIPDVIGPGDVATFDFGGGDHHVSIIDHVEGDMYVCIGANQSHTVKLSTYRKDQCTAIRTPTN